MKETINKIDAASRQLDTAITLWFSESDPISIHTLACSAHEIIKDINKHRKGPPLFFDSDFVKNIFAEKYHHEIEKHLKNHYNFFKHANKDPDEFIEFDQFFTQLFIMFSCIGLRNLGSKFTNFQLAFIIFFTAHNPATISEHGHKSLMQVMPFDILAASKKIGRKDFLSVFISRSNVC